jgi:pyruvate,orthophosphate dikinase
MEALSRAAALVTARGARTSHAAVVARQMGKPCIVSCDAIEFDDSREKAYLAGSLVTEGDLLSVDGTTGEIYSGTVSVARQRPQHLLEEVSRWREQTALGEQ